MYGYEKKCKEQIEADTFFLHESDKIDMDRKVACVHEIERAWEYFNTNNLDSSMKRFNQAWLLDSTNIEFFTIQFSGSCVIISFKHSNKNPNNIEIGIEIM